MSEKILLSKSETSCNIYSDEAVLSAAYKCIGHWRSLLNLICQRFWPICKLCPEVYFVKYETAGLFGAIHPITINLQTLHLLKKSSTSTLTLFPEASLPFPSSATWKRRFSSRMTDPVAGLAQAASTSAPTQSFRKVTSLQSHRSHEDRGKDFWSYYNQDGVSSPFLW